MIKNYGYIKDSITKDDYILGGISKIPKEVLVPDGQWDNYLPTEEFQNIQGIETSACATFHTLNPVEILIKRLYNKDENFSDRFLAWNSGTSTQGNSPHTVSEYLRKGGVPYQMQWPNFDNVDSFEEFYKTPPAKLIEKARDFLNNYSFSHEWVNTDTESLKNALQYSPLGASVQAWEEKDGYNIRTQPKDNHWVVIYGYKDKEYWKVFDSYENTHKKLVWNYGFGMCKRYHIQKLEKKS